MSVVLGIAESYGKQRHLAEIYIKDVQLTLVEVAEKPKPSAHRSVIR